MKANKMINKIKTFYKLQSLPLSLSFIVSAILMLLIACPMNTQPKSEHISEPVPDINNYYENQEYCQSITAETASSCFFSVSVAKLNLKLEELTGTKADYILDGADAAKFELLDDDGIKIEWKNNDIIQTKQTRVHKLDVMRAGSLALRLELNIIPPPAMQRVVSVIQYYNITPATEINFMMDPDDFNAFYFSVGDKIMGVRPLPNSVANPARTLGYLNIDCESITCDSGGFPDNDFSYVKNQNDSNFSDLKDLVGGSFLENERCEPMDTPETRPLMLRAKNHDYVVTRVNETDGSTLNGDPFFFLASSFDQAICFGRAYIYEDFQSVETIPDKTKHLTNLPPNMAYPHEDYKLIFNADFEDIANDYDPADLLSELEKHGLSVKHSFPKDAFPGTTEDKKDDPIFVEDGQLYLGHGVTGGGTYECDPDDLEEAKRAEAFHPDKCVNNGSASLSTRAFKYGYLEINISKIAKSRTITNWLRMLTHNKNWHKYFDFANSGTGGVFPYYATSTDNPNPPIQSRAYWPEIPESITTGVNANLDKFKYEMYVTGSELQLMENLNYPWQSYSPFFWTVNHYGYNYNTSGNARWYYTVYTTNYESLVYGMEWTPQGYIIWHNKNNEGWVKKSTANLTGRGVANYGSSHQCKDYTSGMPQTIITKGDHSVNGVIQCGINHTAQLIHFSPTSKNGPVDNSGRDSFNYYWCKQYYETDGKSKDDIPTDSRCNETYIKNGISASSQGPASRLTHKDRVVGYDSIRVYKPKNDYSDMEKLNQ